MEWVQFLRQLLLEAEAEHSRLGLPTKDWADWYAEYCAPRIMASREWFDTLAKPDLRSRDGITEGD